MTPIASLGLHAQRELWSCCWHESSTKYLAPWGDSRMPTAKVEEGGVASTRSTYQSSSALAAAAPNCRPVGVIAYRVVVVSWGA